MESTPARIHLIPARGAPFVAVIRRKPSQLYHILRWNTETDEIEQGSWFDGRFFETFADISFDGEWMVYLASGRGNTWTGICNLPRLTTIFDLENDSTDSWGGVFTAPNRLELLFGQRTDVPSAIFRIPSVSLPFQLRVMHDSDLSEVGSVLLRRFERDGYTRSASVEEEASRILPTWEMAPSPGHPQLRIRHIWHPTHNGQDFAFDLPDLPGFLDSEVTWAAYDSLGQLVVARRGVLLRYTLEAIGRWEASAAIDLEQLSPGIRFVKEDKAPVDDRQIRVVEGLLEDQPVKALIVPTAKVHWAERIRELAGGMVRDDTVPVPGEFKVGDAYYLRQHYLVHTHEPPPSVRVSDLQAFCKAVFEGSGFNSGTTTLALKLIGLASGWPQADCIEATVESALQFVVDQPMRKVVLVASDREEADLIRQSLWRKKPSD